MDKLALTFQSSIYLWGLLTLAIPIVIHLLSKHKGKIVPFAHIALIQVKNSPQLNQARITQWLLLILRLLMLLVACGILAQAFWNKNAQTSNETVLVSADWLTHSSDADKQQLIDDHPENATSDKHWILIDSVSQPEGVRRLNAEQLLTFGSGEEQPIEAQPLNIWANVATIALALPESQIIWVYTTDRMNQFSGQFVAPSGQVGRQIGRQIEWHVKALPFNQPDTKFDASLIVVSDQLSQEQLHYLEGALGAIADTLPVNLSIEYLDVGQVQNNLKIKEQHTRIIYLANTPVPAVILDTQAHVLTSTQLQDYKNPDFPLTLATKLFDTQAHDWFVQNARLSVAQISQQFTQQLTQQLTQQPSSNAAHTNVLNNNKSQSLHIWLMLILVILFVVERVLSEWPAASTRTVADS